MIIHPVVLVLAFQQLALGRLEVRRLDPVPGHDARQGDADAGGAVEPARAGAAGELQAEVAGEVVAVLGEQVVGGALELVGGVADDGVDLGLRREREAVEDLGPKSAARGFRLRPRPVHARDAALVVPAVGIFLTVYDNSRV